MLQTVVSGLAGLLGVVIGACATYWSQEKAHQRTRRSQVEDARFSKASDFLARSQGIFTEYRMLDLILGKRVTVEITLSDEDRKEHAETLFKRGLDAWSSYRNVHAQLMANPDRDIRKRAEVLHEALDRWVNSVDAEYLGVDVVEYEASYEYSSGAGTKNERETALEKAVDEYEKILQQRAPLTTPSKA